MNNLLHANFMRLKKDKVFWGGIILNMLLCIIACISMYGLMIELDITVYSDNLALGSIILIGVILSVFSSLFVGTEYSNGIIRNKIVVGQHRYNIYLSNFISCAIAGIITYLVSTIITCGIAIPLFGFFHDSFPNFLLLLADGILICIAYASIYNLIAMSISNQTHGAVISILLAVVLLLISFLLFDALSQPEFISGLEITANNEVPHSIMEENPFYVTGFQRKLYEFFFDFLPSGQSMQINQRIVTAPIRLAIYSGIITITSNLIGVFCFQRKEIK